jgi:hypothetical protein
MTAPQAAFQQLMMDAAVDTSVNMTARMLGLPPESVTKIMQVGLPMMAKMAETNPELLKTLYEQSVTLLPEPAQEFYAKLAENPEAQQKLIDNFQTMAGPMMESLNRETAREAGITEAQAGTALATTYPAVAEALATRNADKTPAGFAQQLRNMAA